MSDCYLCARELAGDVPAGVRPICAGCRRKYDLSPEHDREAPVPDFGFFEDEEPTDPGLGPVAGACVTRSPVGHLTVTLPGKTDRVLQPGDFLSFERDGVRIAIFEFGDLEPFVGHPDKFADMLRKKRLVSITTLDDRLIALCRHEQPHEPLSESKFKEDLDELLAIMNEPYSATPSNFVHGAVLQKEDLDRAVQELAEALERGAFDARPTKLTQGCQFDVPVGELDGASDESLAQLASKAFEAISEDLDNELSAVLQNEELMYPGPIVPSGILVMQSYAAINGPLVTAFYDAIRTGRPFSAYIKKDLPEEDIDPERTP